MGPKCWKTKQDFLSMAGWDVTEGFSLRGHDDRSGRMGAGDVAVVVHLCDALFVRTTYRFLGVGDDDGKISSY